MKYRAILMNDDGSENQLLFSANNLDYMREQAQRELAKKPPGKWVKIEEMKWAFLEDVDRP